MDQCDWYHTLALLMGCSDAVATSPLPTLDPDSLKIVVTVRGGETRRDQNEASQMSSDDVKEEEEVRCQVSTYLREFQRVFHGGVLCGL